MPARPLPSWWRRLGRSALFLRLALSGLAAASAEGLAYTVHSRSGQFIVHSATPTPPSLARVAPTGTETNRLIPLYPDPLAVSCERIKSAVLAELRLPDRWRGKVHVTIDPRAPADAFPAATGRRYLEGWHFALRLPPEIEPPTLVRGVVHAVLLEIILRQPAPRAPEVPLWLLEALTGQVLSRVGPDPVARPNPITGKFGNTVGQLVGTLRERGPAEEDQRVLGLIRTHGWLTFEDISLPVPERLSGPSAEHYRACCQTLFVALRNLPQGPSRLNAFLARLPQHLNWQTAFLEAYAPLFPRLLEVEKWWALVGQQLGAPTSDLETNARLGAAWLEDLLSVEVVTRSAPGAAVNRQTVTFADVLQSWDFPRQRTLFAARSQALRRLARVVPDPVAGLALAYAQTLEQYVAARQRLSYQPGLRGAQALHLAALLESTRTQLETLEARRRELHPAPPMPPPAAPEDASPNPAENSPPPNRPAPGPEAAGVKPPQEPEP